MNNKTYLGTEIVVYTFGSVVWYVGTKLMYGAISSPVYIAVKINENIIVPCSTLYNWWYAAKQRGRRSRYGDQKSHKDLLADVNELKKQLDEIKNENKKRDSAAAPRSGVTETISYIPIQTQTNVTRINKATKL